MITLDEAIIHAQDVAEEYENVVNTGAFKDGYTVAEFYCDDTECIEAHLSRCAKYAEEHRQLAEWLKDYKRLLQKEPCEDAISREDVTRNVNKFDMGLEFAKTAYTKLLLTEKPTREYIFKSDNILYIITNFTASEIFNAIENLGLSVGDEIMWAHDPMGRTFVITRINNLKIEGKSRDKCLCELDVTQAIIRTGRHFYNVHEYY